MPALAVAHPVFSPPVFSPRRWLEIWVGPDADTDRLLVLRSAEDGACDLIDPETGWRPLQRFASYDAAAGWLTGESYARGGGRCAAP